MEILTIAETMGGVSEALQIRFLKTFVDYRLMQRASDLSQEEIGKSIF